MEHLTHESVERVGFTTGSLSNEDYHAVRNAAGFAVLPDRLIVRITGDDRVAFMHGMCTNDIKSLRSGEASHALILTERAHVITEFYVLVSDDALILDTDRKLWPHARRHLEKLLVADDVEFEECENLRLIAIFGPSAESAANIVAGGMTGSLRTWRHIRKGDSIVVNLPRLGSPGISIIADRGAADQVLHDLRRKAVHAREVDLAALELLRIENGVVQIGVDTTEKTIALEARLESAISFNKGCYLGQETIERASARGALKKRLCGLRIEGQPVSGLNLPVMLDAKEVGRLSSFATSLELGPIGLSILHHSAWALGTKVTIRDSASEQAAAVCELPFVKSQNPPK